ncbi:mitochondrial metalloendopeptidase OMA1-like [Bidens hawaiensis]|uniref:mitochondrial metalloendopeptidase OMA1-like n=1 Tax=Bidens hawaiensis TaxID=980011 RepID=UPI00404B99BC
MALWYRRSKGLGFGVLSKITTSTSFHCPPVSTINRPPVSIINRPPFCQVPRRSLIVDRYHAGLLQQVKMMISPFKLFKWAILGFAVYVFTDFETIPYTKRKHLLILPTNYWKLIGWLEFIKMRSDAETRGILVPDMDFASTRVKRVLNDVTQALQTTLNDEVSQSKFEEGVSLADSHVKTLDWQVLLVNEDAMSALCSPHGKIVLRVGLLQQFTTDEEIAAIIAHELYVAHIVARHADERFTKNLWLAPVRAQFFWLSRPPFAVDSWTATFFALDRPFSQKLESEADHIGLLLMASAGYDPRVAPKVYEKLVQASSDSSLEDYSSIHPPRKKRVKLLLESAVMQKAISVYEVVKWSKV